MYQPPGMQCQQAMLYEWLNIEHDASSKGKGSMDWQAGNWRMSAIRGATTVSENSAEAIAEAVTEMLDDVEARNQLDPTQIVSVTFSVTRDLDAIFPAAIARRRPKWDCVPLLDVQQMHVEGALARCIRLMMVVPLRVKQSDVNHAYMRGARSLRPDLCLTSD